MTAQMEGLLVEEPASVEDADMLDDRCREHRQRNPRRAEELDRARAQIAQVRGMHDEDRLAAFDRAADAITDGIRIFISYKSEDQTLGILFKEMLADYGAKRLHEEASGNPDIFLAAQSIRGGDDWRKEIKACIKRTHWFILLLPDVEIDRDWLVWEAGYFDRGMCQEAGERLICVHHPNAAQASQLQHYQGYTSDAQGIENLLTDLFFTPNAITGMQPVAPPLKLGNLKRDALELSKAFRAPQQRIEPIYCLKHVDIAHREGATYLTVEELLDAEVLHAHELDDIFNRRGSFRGTVGELIGDIHDDVHGKAWVGDLARVLNDVVTGRPPRRTMVPFFGYSGPGQFRACLHCVRRASAGGPIASFRILFVEEFAGAVGNAPPDLDALETALHWSYRSWWELIDRFRGGVHTQQQLDAIRQYIERAELEAQSRNAMDPAKLGAIFAKRPAEHETLIANQKRYYNEFRNPGTGDGKIDQALRDRRPELMADSLSELRPIIAWFLVHGARRYAELVEERLAGELPKDERTG
jgi:hypothetical protein